MNKKVLVLGGNGMLGSMVVDYLSKKEDIDLAVSLRNPEIHKKFVEKYKNIKYIYLDFKDLTMYENIGCLYDEYIVGYDYIVNCVGATKPTIDEKNFETIKRAIEVNSILPYYLKDRCEKTNTILIQILTDCVFYGNRGEYFENSIRDAVDIYGRSKVLGEYSNKNVVNLRTSIIGPEIDTCKFLFEWFLQNENESVSGFIHHYWNGITTLAFAKLIYAIISNSLEKEYINKTFHIYSKENDFKYDKYSLLEKIKNIFEKDIEINKEYNENFVNRKLLTIYLNEVIKLWSYVYNGIPTIDFLLEELKEYMDKEWAWKR
jgi:dTDP-4-dehydrorhamnose reductase